MMPMPPPGMRRPMRPRGFLTEEEKKNMPKITKELLLRILSYLAPYKWYFLLVLAALILSAVLGLLPSVITGKIVDSIVEISGGGDISRLIMLVAIAFGVVAAAQILTIAEQYINTWISQKIIFDMRNEMYDHLQHMPHSFFTNEKQGDIITRMNSDINGVSSVVSGTLTSIVSNALTVIVSAVYLFYTDWRMALAGVAVMPLLLFPTRYVSKKRWKLVSIAQDKQDKMNQQIDETLSVSGSLLVKLFTKENKEFEDFKNINGEYTDITVKEQRAGSWFRVLMGMIMQSAPLVLYFVGGVFIIKGVNGNLTVGDITVIVTLINRMSMPIRTLLDVHVSFVRSMALFDRIFEYLDRTADIKNPENPLTPDLSDCSVEFKDVKFAYNEEKPILKGISFKVPKGKMHAIVGTSGAGKSTIIGMIPRLYDPKDGTVFIAGVNVKDFDLSYLRQNVGMVTQDTYLFNGTILENLLYAKEDATLEEIENACKVANIYDFIVTLPDKFNTVVGNRGLKLSGGEKQRVSIARVVLKNPKVLILDEATSSLDSISENLIQEALDRVMENRTSIVIAHRLSTVMAADKIMVLENGVITASGSHDSLLDESYAYRNLYETQFRKVIDYEKERNTKKD